VAVAVADSPPSLDSDRTSNKLVPTAPERVTGVRVNQDHRREIASLSFADFGADRLSRLCHAVGSKEQARDAAGVFRQMLAPWGERAVGAQPRWPSDIVDDHTPFELSISLGGSRPEVRVLVEAQGETPTLRAQQQAGRALSARLERDFGADLGRLRRVEDLFLPADPRGDFALWHAASFRGGRPIDSKVYLNLQARGRPLAPALAEEALVRLGMSRAWPSFARIAASRGFDADELLYFSLDLSARPDARVKIYVRHHRATARELEAALALAPQYEPGHAARMIHALGGGEGPFTARALVTCFSYVEGDLERPSEATLYFPIGGYVAHDLEATARISLYLKEIGVSTSAYEAAIEAVAWRPLDRGVGLQSYVSLRHEQGQPRLTMYFGPEAYSTQPPRTAPNAAPMRPAPTPEEIVRRHEAEPLTNHPFFRRLRREPVDHGRLWTLMSNFRVALIEGFPRMVASLVARVEQDPIRCVLAKQLNDELGNGDFTRAHKNLFARLMGALSPWRPERDEAELHAPGHALRRELERLYFEADPSEGVGATLLVEVYGKHVDQFLGDEFRRQDAVDRESLTWLTLHEDLEEDHADDSLTLAALLPDGASRAAAARGAEAVAAASQAYFDALYELCFP
jgi:DMATS type aromatic prenyltransferase